MNDNWLNPGGFPLVVLSHRRRAYIEDTVASLRAYAHGISTITVVDDSGDPEHHEWLRSEGYRVACSSPDGSHVGYLGAMQTAWEVMRSEADAQNRLHAMLWEEDFVAVNEFDAIELSAVLDRHPGLAQLNLQRQAVYRIERRFGYMESHVRRGYGLVPHEFLGIPWVRRAKPFTTNPCMIQRHVLNVDWPSRAVCDKTPGGAEPAMSEKLERLGYKFGWYGKWNTPHTRHVGNEMKTGKGY